MAAYVIFYIIVIVSGQCKKIGNHLFIPLIPELWNILKFCFLVILKIYVLNSCATMNHNLRPNHISNKKGAKNITFLIKIRVYFLQFFYLTHCLVSNCNLSLHDSFTRRFFKIFMLSFKLFRILYQSKTLHIISQSNPYIICNKLLIYVNWGKELDLEKCKLQSGTILVMPP